MTDWRQKVEYHNQYCRILWRALQEASARCGLLVKGFFKKKGKECMMEGRAVGVGEDGKGGGGWVQGVEKGLIAHYFSRSWRSSNHTKNSIIILCFPYLEFSLPDDYCSAIPRLTNGFVHELGLRDWQLTIPPAAVGSGVGSFTVNPKMFKSFSWEYQWHGLSGYIGWYFKNCFFQTFSWHCR